MSVYCQKTDLETRISALGVSLRIDDTNDAAVIDCITDASSWVDYYCLGRYTTEVLFTSAWIKYRTRDIAIYYLCLRRLNPAPKAVEQNYETAIKELTRIQSGEATIPGLPVRKSAAPVLSQPRTVMFPYPYTAIERNRSTGNPTGYPQRNDPNEPTYPN